MAAVLCPSSLTRDPGVLAAVELRRPVLVTVRGDKDGDEAPEGAEHVLITADTCQSLLLSYSPSFRPVSACSRSRPVIIVGSAALIDTQDEDEVHGLTLAQDVTHEGIGGRGVLMSTKSVEATRRLVRLSDLFRDHHGARAVKRSVVRLCSSEMTAGGRRRLLHSLGLERDVSVLVASDLIARAASTSPPSRA
ncbi:hypothetical protein V8E36_006401 [Tilletia maclaganii]